MLPLVRITDSCVLPVKALTKPSDRQLSLCLSRVLWHLNLDSSEQGRRLLVSPSLLRAQGRAQTVLGPKKAIQQERGREHRNREKTVCLQPEKWVQAGAGVLGSHTLASLLQQIQGRETTGFWDPRHRHKHILQTWPLPPGVNPDLSHSGHTASPDCDDTLQSVAQARKEVALRPSGRE